MTYDLVIKNGHVVNADASFTADVAINGEIVAAIGQDLSGEREIDAAGKLVTPGAVDVHVHMELALPGVTSSDTFFTGTRAAAHGGTTTIIDFVECAPHEPMLDALARRCAQADPQVVIDYGLHMTIGPHEINKLNQLPDAIKNGCVSLKLYMAYGHYLDDGQLLRALAAIAQGGGLAVIHAENWKAILALTEQSLAAGHTTPEHHPRCRPAPLEGEAAGRAIDIATYVGAPLHIFHVGCTDVVERITAARAKKLPITGETCPQYLMLTEDLYAAPGIDGALPVCAPPLRAEHHREAMWHALANDHLQIVTTDHAPFTKADKMRGIHANDFTQIPGGVPSIEVRYPVVYSHGVGNGHLTENQWVDVCCTRPARMFGLGSKGVLAPGYDADVVIFNSDKEWVVSTNSLHENCDWTPYNGTRITGKVESTFVRGKAVIENGAYVGSAGTGKFIVRALP